MADTDCPGRLIPKMPQESPSDVAHEELTPSLRTPVLVKFVHPHLLIIITEPAWHHNGLWGSRCNSNHTPTISLKLCISFAAISAILLTHEIFHHTAYLTTSNGHQVHFPPISAIFSPNSLHFGKSLLKQTFQCHQLKNIMNN